MSSTTTPQLATKSTAPPPTQHFITPKSLSVRHELSIGHLANLRSAGLGVAYLKLGSAVQDRLSDVEAYEAASMVSGVAA